jgi:RHS repeat-associated protein
MDKEIIHTRGSDLSGSLEGAGGIGGLLARSESNGSGGWTNHAYYFAAGNGNIVCMVDADGNIVASYRYDPFGNTISQDGPLADANHYRFYDPNLQRWLNRDPIDELGHLLLTTGQRAHIAYDANLCCFVRNSPPNFHDADGHLIGYVSSAFAAAIYACAKPQYDAAFTRYPDSGDRFKHCWVSCRVSKTSGGDWAYFAGLGKELRDSVVRVIKGSHNDPWIDSLQDLLANKKCIGWESQLGSAPGGWIGALCRRSCEDCCKEKVGYYTGSP